jgi:cell division protein FtsB
LVKAVQAQQQEIEKIKGENTQLRTENELLIKQLQSIEHRLNKLETK